MAVKIITFLSILIINVAVGVGFVVLLMLALNGFGGRAANYAFGIFIAGGISVSILMAAGGIFLLKFLLKKDWNAVLAVLLSIIGFVALGFVLKVVIFFVSILAADFVRTSR
jgi:hypothetical protein